MIKKMNITLLLRKMKNKKLDELVKMRRRYQSLQTRHRNQRAKVAEDQKSLRGQPINTTVTNEQGARRVVRRAGNVETTTYE